MTGFSCGCDASHEIDKLAPAIARIRAMHVKDASGFCLACDYGWPCDTVKALDAARGAEPHQGDTNAHPDSQRFRYGNGNNIPPAENTILDDSDDEKVVSGNYDDNVTDAGDTPQPATNWVRKPLQTGDADTPATTPPGGINP